MQLGKNMDWIVGLATGIKKYSVAPLLIILCISCGGRGEYKEPLNTDFCFEKMLPGSDDKNLYFYYGVSNDSMFIREYGPRNFILDYSQQLTAEEKASLELIFSQSNTDKLHRDSLLREWYYKNSVYLPPSDSAVFNPYTKKPSTIPLKNNKININEVWNWKKIELMATSEIVEPYKDICQGLKLVYEADSMLIKVIRVSSSENCGESKDSLMDLIPLENRLINDISELLAPIKKNSRYESFFIREPGFTRLQLKVDENMIFSVKAGISTEPQQFLIMYLSDLISYPYDEDECSTLNELIYIYCELIPSR